MKHFVRIAKISIVSLLLGLFVGAPAAMQSAVAVDTVTKTIVVRGANGALLPNALVAVGYTDNTNDIGWSWTDAVTTDSQGQAVISGLPASSDEAELYIEPATADSASAVMFKSTYNDGFSLVSSSTEQITLLSSSIHVNIKLSTNSPAPLHSSVYWPNDNSYQNWSAINILREGAFGIHVDSSFDCSQGNNSFPIQFGFIDKTLSEAGNSYDAAISNCPSRSFELQDGLAGVTPTKTANVWQLVSHHVNFRYNIVSPTDASRPLPGTQLNVCRVVQNQGDRCYFGGNKAGEIGLADGTYKIRVNALNNPYVSTQFTAIISNNGSTTVLKEGYPATEVTVPIENGLAKFALAAPNFSGWVTNAAGETFTNLSDGQYFDIRLQKRNLNGDWNYVTSVGSTGKFAFKITEAGTYQLSVEPYGIDGVGLTRSAIITVVNSNGIKLSSNGVSNQANLIQNTPVLAPNFSGSIKKANGDSFILTGDQHFDVSLQMKDENGDFRGLDGQYSTGAVSFVFNEVGVYRIRVEPNGISGYAPSNSEEINVTESNGIKLAWGTGNSSSTLAHDLLLTSSNLSGSVKNPDGSAISFGNGQFIDVQLQKKNENGDFQWVDSTGTSNGNFEFIIDSTGEYRVETTPYGLPNLATAKSATIYVTDSSGLKLALQGETPTSTLALNVRLAVPNVRFNVRNPIDGSFISQGWISVQKLIDDNGRTNYWGNLNINLNNPGHTSGLFENGRYQITVNPPQGRAAISGLAQQSYYMVVADQGITLETGTVSTGQTVTADQDGSFSIFVGKANITGVYVDLNNQPIPSNNTSNAQICVQQYVEAGSYWNYKNCTNTGVDGRFSISLHDEGLFRLLFQPNGRSDIAASYSATFTINSGNVASYEQSYGNVMAAAPTLKLRVREDGRTTNLKYVGIEIRKGDQWIGWANTAQNGVVAVTLTTAGTYQLIANPTDSTPEASRKTYTVTAVADGDGRITATIAGVTADSSGISTLTLGTAQLRGHVYDPTGATALRDSWVVAIDTLNGNQEMWQYGTNTRADGTWSMSLPAGTYSLYARTPYGNTLYGDSAPLGTVTVNSQGAVAISGAAQSASLTAAAFNIRLAEPYWKGKVLEPTGNNGVANARVCLNVTIAGSQIWKCANTDSQGNWAMAKPAGFVAFGDNDQLQIAENQSARFSMATFQGEEIEATDFKAAGNTTAMMRLAAPNFTVRVVYGDNQAPANNMWVNLNAIAGGWLGGSQTDSNGYAKFRVADLSQGVQVQIDPNNNPDIAAVTATTIVRYEDSDMASHETGSGATLAFSDTITMSVPNLKVVITDPNNGNATVANSWVEIFNASTNEWKGGSNSNFTGNASLNLPASATYNVKVNPSWNSTSVATSHTYAIVVNGSGVITSVTDKATNTLVTASQQSGAYSFTLGRPSVTGVVKTPGNSSVAVQNSWVVPTDTNGNMQLWQLGANSRSNGSFSMAVPNGTFTIQANAPWNTSTYSSSQSCAVTISGGQVTSSVGGCIQDDHSLVLTLRLPNLTVHVTDKDGIALQNAHVGIGLGNWNVNGQTDKNGNAALFIDPVAIGTANNGQITGTQNLWMWIDPPYGNSNVVRTQCYSGQAGTPCESLAQVTPGSGDFAQATINAALPAPNTTINIKRPDGTTSAGPNVWVSIMSIIKNQQGQEIGRNWIAGANTDATGKATFNIIDTSVAFIVQVEAPWNQRDTYAGATYDTETGVFGLPWTSINSHNFNLALPNLTMSALRPGTSTGITSGWVSVEKANDSNNSIGWVAGYGLDQNGKVSMKLEANGRFKVTVNPGPGVGGVSTSCIVTTDGDGDVSIVSGECANGTILGTVISLPLATGNVTGTVTDANGDPVIGAIVTANTTLNPSDAKLQVTSTDDLGNYSFELDRSVNWNITVTPVNLSTDVVKLAARTLTNRDVPNSGQLDADVELAAVVG